MTTGVVATVHGRLWDALGANPAAPLLVVVVILAWVGWAITRLGVAPALVRWSPPRWVRPAAELARYPLLGLLWLFELHRFGYV